MKFKSLETKLIHAGELEPRIGEAVSLPISQSSTYEYSGESEDDGLRYIRHNNTPNHEALHGKLAALENGEEGLVTSSGMSAIATTLLGLLSSGDHLLAQKGLYGGTHGFMSRDFSAFGVSVDFIDGLRPDSWSDKLQPTTRAIFAESLTNPLLEVGDLTEIVKFAQALGNAQLHRQTEDMRSYLESVRQSTSKGIIILDHEFQVITANRAALELFSRTSEEFLGTNLRDHLGSLNPCILGHIERAYSTRKQVTGDDVELEFEDSRFSVNLNILPPIDQKNNQGGLVTVLEDISQEKRVRNTWTHYLEKDIVDRVLEDPERQVLGGERSKVTILFADIRGFTRVADTLTAEEVVEFLNQYFTRMGEVISREQGVLDKHMGDGLMALFGVPYSHEDDAARAVRASLKMTEGLAQLNQERKADELEPIRIGIGINTDEVISGNIGSEKRMDFTVVGDGVNVSSRLEKLTKSYGTRILISPATQEETCRDFVTRPIDKVLIRGKKEPVWIFEVMGDLNYELSAAEAVFSEGMEAYKKGNFAAAAKLFDQGAETDRLCYVFRERCKELTDNPPDAAWDGPWFWENRGLVRTATRRAGQPGGR